MQSKGSRGSVAVAPERVTYSTTLLPATRRAIDALAEKLGLYVTGRPAGGRALDEIVEYYCKKKGVNYV